MCVSDLIAASAISRDGFFIFDGTFVLSKLLIPHFCVNEFIFKSFRLSQIFSSVLVFSNLKTVIHLF